MNIIYIIYSLSFFAKQNLARNYDSNCEYFTAHTWPTINQLKNKERIFEIWPTKQVKRKRKHIKFAKQIKLPTLKTIVLSYDGLT